MSRFTLTLRQHNSKLGETTTQKIFTIKAKETMMTEMTMGATTVTTGTTMVARKNDHVKNMDAMFLIVVQEKTLKHAKKL